MSGSKILFYLGGIILLSLVALIVLSQPAAAQNYPSLNGGNPSNSNHIISAICGIFSELKEIIFLVILVLMIFGAVMYAGANFLGQSLKKQFEGYGMAIMVGSVIGLVAVLLAPYIIITIVHISGGIGSSYGVSQTAGGLLNYC